MKKGGGSRAVGARCAGSYRNQREKKQRKKKKEKKNVQLAWLSPKQPPIAQLQQDIGAPRRLACSRAKGEEEGRRRFIQAGSDFRPFFPLAARRAMTSARPLPGVGVAAVIPCRVAG